DRKDPAAETRIQKFTKMRHRLDDIVTGGLVTLTERQAYRAPALARLVGYMRETFPVIVPQMPPAAQAGGVARADAVCDDAAQEDLRPALRELRITVKGAVAK